ncbi:Uncharacterised protein [Vibrio cholerae]|uniref:Uncharacterized protein n=1 Tax=Vibrio cholerae TaxID=666 RepID=A0A655SKY6_VIBCL|nr:Uncharacterised protein [Vibrio cholerae]CSD12267.1 Uncharacterised protein [Vibrio cholerae]CSI03434.1 Uncharacterised protein [Vibrio cholerae]
MKTPRSLSSRSFRNGNVYLADQFEYALAHRYCHGDLAIHVHRAQYLHQVRGEWRSTQNYRHLVNDQTISLLKPKPACHLQQTQAIQWLYKFLALKLNF